ncbi:hypothetical protein GH5_06196 [Leishmania sp. Ghana 2012 LV757]|uniref:hypothetical protein n=1 Tax=Leishmania sp. Ghana 2012 LV757 TaxID=2803181 RepID=UPI001B761FD7|nr:hypothetical protein GH5_06196 [Leishmania sp. Ghana 2012 LV757]
MPPPSSVSGRYGSSVRVGSATAESVSAMPAKENMTLLQALAQPTRHRRRVQPRFEAFSLDGPDCTKYSLESHWPQYQGGDATAFNRDGPRQTGSRNRGEPASEAAQLRTSRKSLRLANGVPLPPSAAGSGSYCTESRSTDPSRQSRSQERAAQSPPARLEAARRGSSSRHPPSPVRRVAEEGLLPTLSGLIVAEEGCNDSEGCVSGPFDREAYSDSRCRTERPPPQRALGQPLECSPSSLQGAENVKYRPCRHSAQLQRDKRYSEVGGAALLPHRSSASKADALSGGGGARLRSGHGGCGEAAATEHQDEYEPSVVENHVDRSRPQRFQDALPAAAQCYRRLHVVGANGGVSGTVVNSAACEDGGAEWEDAFDEWDGDGDAAAATACVRSLYRENGDVPMEAGSGVHRGHDGADGEPPHRQGPPPASKEAQPHPLQPASLPAEAPGCLPLRPRKPPTGRIPRQAAHMAASQPPLPVEGGAIQPSKTSKKKERSKRHNPRAFRNRTTYTWVSTNTTTSVILPHATVQLVPLSTFPMVEDVQPVEGRWAVAAPLSPPSPYALSSRSVSSYHQRRSQMEVLDDSAESPVKARNRAGNSLPHLPSCSRAE